MLVYLHPSQQPVTPPWLEQYRPADGLAVELCRRGTQHGHLVGIGDPLVFDCPPLEAFAELDAGWRVAQVGQLDPLHLLRQQRWCRTVSAEAIAGSTWQAPVILDADGNRSFLVSYGGRDFLPMLTPEQQRCEAVAQAARAALIAGDGIDIANGCQWAAVLLSATHHVAPEVVAAVGILDDQLVHDVLVAATGLTMKAAT